MRDEEIHTFNSHCPAVGREMVDFIQLVRAGGKWQEIPFEREILWLRESEARSMEFHEGIPLENKSEEDGGWNDFYGFCTSLDSDVIGAAKGRCQWLKITSGSTLEIAVEGRILNQPVLFSKEPERKGWKTEYAYLPGEWLLPETKTETYDDGTSHSWHPRLERRIVEPWTRIWSSQWPDPDARHAALVAEWKAAHGVKAAA